jgi:hypothetical protein
VPTSRFPSERFVAANLKTDPEMNDYSMGHTDASGRFVARWFLHQQRLLGLSGDRYVEFVKFVETIHRHKAVGPRISKRTLENLTFDWMAERYKGNSSLTVAEYLEDAASHLLEEVEVWLPISDLSMESELQLGKVILKVMTAERIEQWYSNLKSSANEGDRQSLEMWLDRRRKLQGFMAATMMLNAEPLRCLEIISEETERSLAMLRFFAPANFVPGVISYCVPLGKENLETHWCLFVGTDGIRREFDGISDPSYRPWQISDADIESFRDSGLEMLNMLLLNNKRSDYQARLYDSLLFYGRNSLARDATDKLLHIVTSLEAFLLRSENEPIGDNIARRIAFAVESQAAPRRRVVEIVKGAYSLRSKFVHHAQRVADVDKLQDFLLVAWKFFMVLIMDNTKYRTRDEFLNELDNRMYAGSPDA